MKCPKCGSSNVIKGSNTGIYIGLAILILSFFIPISLPVSLPIFLWFCVNNSKNKCNNCGYQWKEEKTSDSNIAKESSLLSHNINAHPQQASIHKYCPACGQENKPGSKFCQHCGRPLS